MENSQNYNELFLKAEELRKCGRHEQAAEMLRQCWLAAKTEDVAWRLISCLRHLQAREEAWQILYEAVEITPDSHLLRNQQQWMLYDFDLADAKSKKNSEKILEVCDCLLEMAPDAMLLQLTVFAATDACKILNLPEKTLQYLNYLNRSALDKTPREYNGNKILSWRERWYFACTNALFELGKFAECREAALEAFRDFPAKIEYARKAALCLAENGNEQQAADELETLTRGRRVPWYMYSDLARLLFECGDTEKAWLNACYAAEAAGETKTKVNLFYLMARMLMAQGNRDAASLHASLAAQARTEQGWSIPEELSDFMQKFNLSPANISSLNLLAACRKFWNPKSPSAQSHSSGHPDKSQSEQHQGSLIMKNPESPFAFIRSRGLSENVYVKTSDIPAELRYDGAQLKFFLQTSFDAKKNRESIRAVRVSVA